MHAKNKALIDKLLSRTQEGKLEWRSTLVPCQFEASLASAKLVIDQDFSNNELYTFTILDWLGEVIDEVEVMYGREDSADFIDLSHLYESARRSAKKIDKTINQLLDELDLD